MPALEHLDKFDKDLCRTCGIIHRTVMVLQRHTDRLCNRIELVAVELRQQKTRHRDRIRYGKVTREMQILTVFLDKAHIKLRIVCHHDTAFAEFHKLRQNLPDQRCVHHHVVTDACQFLNIKRNRNLRIHKRRKPLRDRSVLHFYRTDFDNLIFLWAKAGRLQIKDDKITAEILPLRVFDDALCIVHKIRLHAVDQLEIRPLWNRMVSDRKCLHRTVIRDREAVMSERDCLRDNITDIRHTIHVTHLCMTVQLHTLAHRLIHTLCREIRNFLDTHDGCHCQLMVKTVE